MHQKQGARETEELATPAGLGGRTSAGVLGDRTAAA
jgi:hypothetical protein